jgi:hypothetical protein
MEYRVKKINRELDRISKNSPYTLVQTQEILLKLLEKIEETGDLIELIGFKEFRKEVEKDE